MSLSHASVSPDISKILRTEQPQLNAEIIELLNTGNNEEKLRFFQQAFIKQKLYLFNHPEKHFDEDYPLKAYVRAWSLLAQIKKDPENRQLQKDIHAFFTEHKNDYITERIRTDWLLIMAPTWNDKHQWKNFIHTRASME